MTRTRRNLAIVMPWLILLALTGCGSGVPPRSAALDPSNANGPESPPSSASPALAEPLVAADGENAHGDGRNGEGSEQHAGHGHRAANVVGTPANAIVYTCPMHAEVTSSQPGKCPKCGMNLVPKKDDK